MTADSTLTKPPKKQKNTLFDLLINIVTPSVILMKFSDESSLGPVNGFLVALAFPFLYGIYDLLTSKKFNLFSGVGLLNVGLTGGLGLLKVEGIWFAVKEAAVPLVLGSAVLLSLKTKYPLVRTILLNENVVNVQKVMANLQERRQTDAFEKLLVQATLLLSLSFLLSAILNFVLAEVILQSPTGTPEFNKELGQMTALSFPVIAVPCTIVTGFALWRLVTGIKKLTGMEFEEIFHAAASQTHNKSTVDEK